MKPFYTFLLLAGTGWLFAQPDAPDYFDSVASNVDLSPVQTDYLYDRTFGLGRLWELDGSGTHELEVAQFSMVYAQLAGMHLGSGTQFFPDPAAANDLHAAAC